MSPYLDVLLTLTNGEEVFRVAIEVDPQRLGHDVWEYWAEPENKKAIWQSLPPHVRSLGVIVEVKEIFDVLDLAGDPERPVCRIPGMEVPPPPGR